MKSMIAHIKLFAYSMYVNLLMMLGWNDKVMGLLGVWVINTLECDATVSRYRLELNPKLGRQRQKDHAVQAMTLLVKHKYMGNISPNPTPFTVLCHQGNVVWVNRYHR